MSALTDEWILKTGRNSIRYIMDVLNMDKQITSFQYGRKIFSKEFVIGRSTFRIEVYPGGNSVKNSMFVSVYLRNTSSWRVKANEIISIPQTDVTRSINEHYFESDFDENSDWGFGDLIHHHRCRRGDLLSRIGTLTIQVDVELLEEEVLPSRDLTQENTNERFEKLEGYLRNIDEDIQHMKAENVEPTSNIHRMQVTIKNMESQSARQTAIIQSMNAEAAVQTEAIRSLKARSVSQTDNILYNIQRMQVTINDMESQSAKQTAIIHSMKAEAAMQTDALRSVEARSASQTAIIQSMKAEAAVQTDVIRSMEARSSREINELKRMIQGLSMSPLFQGMVTLEVECPVCMEVARPPMRLKQCGQGHIICDTCQSRAEDCASDDGRNPNICHSCREMITGRPSVLEKVLGLS